MAKYLSQNDFSKIPVKGLVPESGATAPASPANGQLWYDTSVNKLKALQAGGWVTLDTDTNTNIITSVNGKTGAVVIGTADIAGLDASLAGKAVNGHTHDDRYYTEGEIDSKLAAVTIPTATEAAQGKVQLASTTEATTGTDTTKAVTPAGVKAAISALVAGAPAALDTLDELAAALGDDANFRTTILNAIAAKANSTHQHNATDINAGILPIARLGATVATLQEGMVLVKRNGQVEGIGGGTPGNYLRADGNGVPSWQSLESHSHSIAQVNGLQDALNQRSNVYKDAFVPALTAGVWTTLSQAPTVGTIGIEFYESGTNEVVMLDSRIEPTSGVWQVRSAVALAANAIFYSFINSSSPVSY